MFLQTPTLDLNIYLYLNQTLRCDFFDFVMPILSSTTALFVCIAAAAAFAVIKKGKRQLFYFLVLLAAMGISDFSTSLVKDEVKRVRPLNAVAGTYQHAHGFWQRVPLDFVQTKEAGTSFPSAHSSTTMAIAILAMLMWPALKKWPLLLPFLVGYSRIYVGKHYPLDVLGGWIFGVGVAYAVWMIWKHAVSHRLPEID